MSDDIRLHNDDIEYEDAEVEDVEDFEYDGYQVVRREFYAHLFDPAVNFRIDNVTFNSASVRKLRSLYIQILVNPSEKKMLIRECEEDSKDAIKWCRVQASTGKKIPRKILCRMFGVKIYEMMKWNPEYKYKIQGNLIRFEGQVFLLYYLKETEIFTPILKEVDGKKVKSAPYYPEDWRDSFGLPVDEHSESMILNMLEGYQRLEYTQRRRISQKKEGSGQASIFDINGDNNGNK